MQNSFKKRAAAFCAAVVSLGLVLGGCSGGGGGGGPGERTYTVTFNENGGDTGADPGTKTVTTPAVTVDAMPAPPDRAGYIFIGGNAEADGGGASFNAATAVTGNITVYAQWMADQPLSSLTLYKGTSTVDPGKQVAGVTDLASAAAWLMSPGNLASDTEYLAVLGSGLDLSSGFIMGGLPFLYNNITVTIQGDSSVQTIKMKTKSSLEVQSGVTIRLGNNIRLRGYNQTDDGENNGYPLVVVNGGAVEMLAGSEISGNVHERSGGDAYGGGVRLMGGGFAMKGGTIRDNGIIVDGGKPATGRGSWWTTEPSAWRGTRRWIPATKCACG